MDPVVSVAIDATPILDVTLTALPALEPSGDNSRGLYGLIVYPIELE